MNTAQESAAPDVAPAPKSKPAAKPTLSFSKDYKFDVGTLASGLEKMRSDMGRYRDLASKHGLSKTVRDMAGEAHAIVTPEMGAKLRAAGLITAREAEDIRHYSQAIKALEGIATYDARKTAEVAKLKK